MSAHEELLAAVKDVRDRTGDPNAWQAGLSPGELAAVITPTTRPEQLQAIAGKIRQQLAAPPDRERGEAAEAIAHAEAALAHQNSASSQLDMQVITAILNAHLNAVDGSEALTRLQQDTEAAVRMRSDLDTPAGARDFQRFLIGKLRDIRSVVLNARLDDTSKSALMAAWTSLYDASKSPDERASDRAVGTDAETAASTGDSDWDPLLDSLLADDPGLATDDLSGTGTPEAGTAPTAPIAPVPPPMPSVAPGLPSFGATPTGLPLPALGGEERTDPMLRGLDDEGPVDPSERPDPKTESGSDEPGDQHDDGGREAAAAENEPAAAGPTTVTLPDGESVTAASPQLAAAIKAAVGGVAIPDAFQQQGITIPPPGSAVTNPIEPTRVSPADIGIFIDRHALALGPGKALLDGQIQDIATVTGPSFLGWEHPPAPAAAVTPPTRPDTPTPTRPAASSTT
ncbi:hypothetical protein A9X05_07915 [Mycobacterium sp. E3298]|uniref:DUF4226 domain-containing protein n=1 Tax=unclassified Mycobacterium TaxID=2642494 RepID=UPI0007FBC535|nr:MULTISPECIES: DUF4226 domain-containing protein [unclassified Mycobacterium]OBG64010.1 hypothetical protein A5703_00190 [Mycobacterium sp. E188]OBG94776.1 hypothetical protein A9X05_07915 [Mycobacterium sp. E3298]OBH43259.1 hypothetical protein A5691_17590 [Mycobacterium sp. E183]